MRPGEGMREEETKEQRETDTYSEKNRTSGSTGRKKK